MSAAQLAEALVAQLRAGPVALVGAAGRSPAGSLLLVTGYAPPVRVRGLTPARLAEALMPLWPAIRDEGLYAYVEAFGGTDGWLQLVRPIPPGAGQIEKVREIALALEGEVLAYCP